MLAVLHEDRFVDLAPAEVYATLLDEGTYLCSERTMYRVLAENQEVRERRDQLRHPNYAAPELLATARERSSLNAEHRCLIHVDRFRTSRDQGTHFTDSPQTSTLSP